MNREAIRRLDWPDIDGALVLSTTAGWNQRLPDWEVHLRHTPAGCFAATAGERIVGTAIGLDYGTFGWIAMMLVDPEYRGRGLGRALLEAAMESIPGDRPIRLDATPMGRPLYRSCGFEDEAMLTRHVAESSHVDPTSTPSLPEARPLPRAELPAIAGEDGRVFGADRSSLLEWAFDSAPLYAHVLHGKQGAAAYCLGRRGRLSDQIGPVVASNDDEAQSLLAAAVEAAGGGPLIVDLFDERRRIAGWLGTCGFTAARPLYRMQRPPADGSRRHLARSIVPGEFAILGPDFA